MINVIHVMVKILDETNRNFYSRMSNYISNNKFEANNRIEISSYHILNIIDTDFYVWHIKKERKSLRPFCSWRILEMVRLHFIKRIKWNFVTINRIICLMKQFLINSCKKKILELYYVQTFKDIYFLLTVLNLFSFSSTYSF